MPIIVPNLAAPPPRPPRRAPRRSPHLPPVTATLENGNLEFHGAPGESGNDAFKRLARQQAEGAKALMDDPVIAAMFLEAGVTPEEMKARFDQDIEQINQLPS